MPATPTYPGVYVEEIPNGVSTITAVTTSVAADVITLTGKRQSMLASPVAVGSVDSPRFADTYGLEWFARKGGPGVLDRLAATA